MDAENLHKRLKKIIGQINAIDRMVDEDVPCEDILMQINAAKSALHKVGQIILEGHLNLQFFHLRSSFLGYFAFCKALPKEYMANVTIPRRKFG